MVDKSINHSSNIDLPMYGLCEPGQEVLKSPVLSYLRTVIYAMSKACLAD